MRKPGCLRFLCVRCLRARVGRLRFVRAGRLLFHGSPVALTLGCAYTLLCGRFVFARVVEGAGLLWACLLAGGWVSCLRWGCVRLLVFAFLVLAFWWGGGTVWSRRPPLFCPACLLVCLRFGVGLLACAVLPLGAG